ncbi:hypothetical protein BGZ65_005053 [Modicella reniformis]|uniref:FAD-binding domain-containing protein n=1 Tax=Modicella reniformis TaxID=1440133 RepID=A0A9P6IM63_9FUNG|nr:hypothetical protein BGZ65_005053 [Modicella reniformis]
MAVNLADQFSDHKISMSKKVLRTEEKDDKVIIYCADNTTYEGDILVGADGAYSGVRQSLYKRMEEKGILPKVDLESFSIGYVTMVGVARPQNPKRYTQLSENISHFSTVVGENNKSWSVVSVADNSICWGVGVQLPKSQAMEQQFRNSEWGPESNEVMMAEFRDKPCPWGGTMGDVIDDTPKELISKVFLEEKVFKTWYHGRTVLLGDACHKMLPSAGQGAVNAMQDAVVLANCLYNMPDSRPSTITAAFQEYFRQRSDRAAMQVDRSRIWGKIMSGHTWSDRLARHLLLNYIPYWFQLQTSIKTFEYRPQIAWLPLAKERGTGHALPQEGKRDGHNKSLI